MKPFLSIQFRYWFLLLGVTSLLLTCTAAPESATSQPTATAVPPTQSAATTEPTAVTESETVPVGLIYRTESGLWQVDADGQSQMISAKQDGYPSPDLARVAVWDTQNTITITDLTTESEQAFSPENGRLGEFFGWADSQTILTGLWLTPEESDGPNSGHLAVLDVVSGQFAVLDPATLLSSPPALGPNGEIIAYAAFAGPMVYQADTGPQPFKMEGFTGLREFTPDGFSSPAWSPDGLKLAWIVSGPNPAADGAWQTGLLIADIGHQTTQWLHFFDPAPMGARPFAPVWSPDGQWLALRVNGADEAQSGLWLLAADGSVEWKLDGNHLADVVWLADGLSLVHAIFDKDGRTSLGLYDAARQVDYSLDLPPGLPVPSAGINNRAVAVYPIPQLFCPHILRPALVTYGSNQNSLRLTNLNGVDSCQIDFPVEIYYAAGVQTVNGRIFFTGANDEGGLTIWQLAPDGSSQPLPFTAIPGGPTYFVVSADGRFIAWSYTDASQNKYKNSLWVADIKTGQTTSLLTDVTDAGDLRALQPIRFSSDGNTLFYAFQPNGLGGQWFSFNGRYDSLYRISTGGGDPTQIMASCFLCIGDIAPDGNSFAYVDVNDQSVRVMSMDGQLLNTITPLTTDFIGFPSYSPAGQLAFASVTLVVEDSNYGAIASPGTITVVANPGETAVSGGILSEVGLSTLWQWIDEDRLIYNYYNKDDSGIYASGQGIANLDGSSQRLPDLFPLAVLR